MEQGPKFINKKLAIVLIISFILIFGGFSFLWSKSRTVKFATNARETISTLFTQMDSVNLSLSTLYKFITKDDEGIKLTRLTNTFGQFDRVFAVVTKVEYREEEKPDNRLGVRLKDFIKDLDSLFKNLNFTDEKVEFNGKVKGFTTPINDPNKIYRDQRELAAKVLSSAESSKKEIENLEKKVGNGKVPRSLSSLREDLDELSADAEQYLSEAEKTAEYYVLISDLSIELEGSFESLWLALENVNDVNSLVSSFDETTKKLRGLKEELETLEKDDLPQDIEPLHNDTLALFDLVINYFDGLKVLTFNQNQGAIVELTTKTSLKLNQLIFGAKDHEISFWKNNKIMNSYSSLSSQYTQALKKLEKAHDENNFFLLKLFGVR